MKLMSKTLLNEKLHSVWCNTEETFAQDRYSTNCYICKGRVKPSNLKNHLYFGYVKCEFCGRAVTSCEKFNSPNLGSKEPETCKHAKLDWVSPPVDYLKSLWQEDEETFDRCLSQYLKTLESLKYIEPFGEAIACCKLYLKEKVCSTIKQHQQQQQQLLEPDKESLNPSDAKNKTQATATTTAATATTNTTTTIPVADSCKIQTTIIETKQIPKDRTRKENENTIKSLPVLPQNGFYLISYKPLNDCPNCYEHLDPKYLKFDVSSWLISISCKNCSLLLFFVIDPPDGSETKLTVISC